MATQSVRIPPHNLDAERSLLGSILIDPEAIIKVADQLTSDSFYSPANQSLFAAMLALYELRQPIDAVTLTSQLKKQKELTQAGGAAAVAELSNAVASAANVEHYAKLVSEAATKRRLISVASQITTLA
ncbi:MAG: replicative DNA helicase, partial [Candidatus Pacebacteria bacterium CG10_big_fil_rev_8_21_14_0_10_45_6]